MRVVYAALVACLLVLSGCGNTAGCADNADCGDLQVCMRSSANRPGTCTNVDCVSNEHCDLGMYCADGNVCSPGCTSQLDCRAGEQCDTQNNQCVAYGCRDTDLDCGYGEFCVGGQCQADTAPHCDTGCDPFLAGTCGAGNQCLPWNLHNACDVYNNGAECAAGQYCGAFEIDGNSTCDSTFNSGCPTGWDCAFFDEDGDGFGDADRCYQGSCFDTRCLVGCDAEADCPRGYSCVPQGGVGQGSLCSADCDFMDQWQ